MIDDNMLVIIILPIFILVTLVLYIFAGYLISSTGLFYGIFILVVIWLLFSGVITIAGLQRNKEGFLKSKEWWKVWNKASKPFVKKENIEMPKNSCRFYVCTAKNVIHSMFFITMLSISATILLTILAIGIFCNLAVGRVPKFCSMDFSEIWPIFAEEHLKINPLEMYGLLLCYFLFTSIGKIADGENLEISTIPIISPMWLSIIGVIMFLALMILKQRVLLVKIIRSRWLNIIDFIMSLASMILRQRVLVVKIIRGARKTAKEKLCIRVIY